MVFGYFGLVLRLGLRLGLGARRPQPRLHVLALVRLPVEPAGLWLVRTEPAVAKTEPASCVHRVAPIRSDWLAGAGPAAVSDGRGPRGCIGNRDPPGIDDARGEGRSRPRIVVFVVVVVVVVAREPTEEIVDWISARLARSRLHDVHHRGPPAAVRHLLAVRRLLRPGLTVRYGRGRSLRYGLLVRVVAVSARRAGCHPAGTSLVVIGGPSAGGWGNHGSTQRPAEILEDLIHQLLRRAALHGADLLPLPGPDVPLLPLEELHELAPVVALLGHARGRRVEAVQGNFIGMVPRYDLGEYVAVR